MSTTHAIYSIDSLRVKHIDTHNYIYEGICFVDLMRLFPLWSIT